MRLPLAAVVALTLAAALVPAAFVGEAQAARCSDHPNQAAAQAAKDTVDADGDGIYCESLPCPCAGAGGGPPPPGPPPSPPPAPRPPPGKATLTFAGRVVRVIDGDTLVVRTYRPTRRVVTVRLVGIDTPERGRCGATQATEALKRLAPPGRVIGLSTDPTQATYDRYRRLLAYVQVPGVSLQRAQLAAGWAAVYVYAGRPFQRVASYRAVEAGARGRSAGVWGACAGNFHRPA